MPGPLLNKKPVGVVVDPYSSGRFLVQHLRDKNIDLVAVQSSLDLADFFFRTFNRNDFIETITHQSQESTLAALSKYDILFCIPGSEPGVELADELSEKLGVLSNGTSQSQCRRDKYHMGEAVRQAGVRAVMQFKSNKTSEILDWVEKWGKFPVVVKPPCSLGTDGVYFCNSVNQVQESCDKIFGHINPAGIMNDAILVQEYLQGIEYVVNCVSYEGKHVLDSIWRYEKAQMNGSFVYLTSSLLASTGEVQDQLVPYIFKVLDALGIRHGPSHAEVMMTADGPVLVEVGARMHGLVGPKTVEICKGWAQHQLTADVYTDRKLFNSLMGTKYTLDKYAVEVDLVSHRSGVLAEPIDKECIKELPSFQFMSASIKPGQKLAKTVDLLTSPGYVILAHENQDILKRDVQFIRNLEHSGLFVLQEDRQTVDC